MSACPVPRCGACSTKLIPVWATAWRTRSASWPMMAYISWAETTFVAAAITCASSGLPPTSCNTFGCFDFSRVPLPAAMMAIATRCGLSPLRFVCDIQINITDKVVRRLSLAFTTEDTEEHRGKPTEQADRSCSYVVFVAGCEISCRRIHDCLGNSVHQKVRNQAGEERPWADGDEIGAGDSFERLRQRLDIGWIQEKFFDPALTGGDLGFASHASAIFH